MLMRLSDEEKAAAWCEAQYGADGSGFLEESRTLAPADHAALEDEALATTFMTTMREAFRQGVRGDRMPIDLCEPQLGASHTVGLSLMSRRRWTTSTHITSPLDHNRAIAFDRSL